MKAFGNTGISKINSIIGKFQKQIETLDEAMTELNQEKENNLKAISNLHGKNSEIYNSLRRAASIKEKLESIIS